MDIGPSTRPDLSTAAVLGSFGAPGSIGVQGSGGTGAVGVDTLNTNPEPASSLSNPQLYFDARMWSGSSFTNLTVKDCDGTAGWELVYYNGSAWQAVAGVTAQDANGCLSVTLTGSASPSLSDLMANGVVFAATNPIEATTTAVTSSAANDTSIYGQ